MIKITKAGWIYIFLTIFLGVAAVNTGNNLVYLIESAMLSFMLVSGFFGRRNLDSLDIQIDLPEEVFARTEFPVKIRIKNRKRFIPSFLLTIHFEGNKLIVPYVGAGEEYTFVINHTYSKRGILHIRDFNVCSVFPFNFFIRCIIYKKNIPVVVYPYPKRCSILQNSSEKSRGKTERAGKGYGSHGEIISVRDYTRGDTIRWIHWKASAKTGELKTKEFSGIGSEPVIIDLDQMDGGKEEKISCATYVVLELYKKGVPFGLKYGKNVIKPEFSRKQKVKILKTLAQI
ncbi:DUF58 domain-containing protein [Persephonella atlantica]|uniref:DUF58 domain-containing protein n=1 Tax=Persephonella atlantica TaxID=2699429 RepID=A0ABS1GFU4_9AQUI|nr:DUF58 domain-containing protein [Persephonella atlantica]MBK3331787.1 DUF58 domain-containing protein [Persephonella atlantica]